MLNYALALEALEADLYVQALQRLTTGGTNGVNKTIPGLGIATSEIDVRYLAQFGTVERQHRDFLNTTLGSQSIASEPAPTGFCEPPTLTLALNP